MTTTIVYQRSFFADLAGDPLDNGSLYIGTANQDPQTHPIQCYWDSALTVPASQPLSISAGYVVNSGSRAAVYVSADSYSLRARNAAGVQVDYVADANDSSLRAALAATTGAALVGVTGGGTVQDKLDTLATSASPDAAFLSTSTLAQPGTYSRSNRARWGDVIDMAEYLDPASGSHSANRTRVQALLNSGAVTDRTVLHFPKGYWRLKALTFPGTINNVRVVGEWPATQLEFDETSNNWITLGANCDYFSIGGLQLLKKSGNVMTGGYAITMPSGAGWYEPRFEDLLIYQPYAGIQTGLVSDTLGADVCHLPTFRSVSIREAVDHSFVFGQCYDPRLTDCYSGKTIGGGVVGSSFLFTSHCQGGYANQCTSIGGEYSWRWGEGDGTDASINAMTLSGCVADNARNTGLAILAADRIFWKGGFVATQQAGAKGVVFGTYCNEGQLEGAEVANVARNGIEIYTGARQTQIRGGFVVSCSQETANTYYGIYAQDSSQDFQIDGVRATNRSGYYSGTQQYGIAIGSSCDNYTIVNNSLRGNATGGLLNNSSGAANKVVANNLT